MDTSVDDGIDKVATSLDADTGKEEHQPNVSNHQRGRVGRVCNQLEFIAETT